MENCISLSIESEICTNGMLNVNFSQHLSFISIARLLESALESNLLQELILGVQSSEHGLILIWSDVICVWQGLIRDNFKRTPSAHGVSNSLQSGQWTVWSGMVWSGPGWGPPLKILMKIPRLIKNAYDPDLSSFKFLVRSCACSKTLMKRQFQTKMR